MSDEAGAVSGGQLINDLIGCDYKFGLYLRSVVNLSI